MGGVFGMLGTAHERCLNPTGAGPLDSIDPGGWGGVYLREVLVPTVKRAQKAAAVTSRDRRAVIAPYPLILEQWDISKGERFNMMALKTG